MTTAREKTLGQTIRELREGKKLSLRALAKQVGVSAPFLGDIEHDRRRTNMLGPIAHALEVHPNSLKALDNRMTTSLKLWVEKQPGLIASLRSTMDSGNEFPQFYIHLAKQDVGK